MGAEGLAARPADASSGEGGGRLLLNPGLLGCLWPNPASFHRLVGSGPPGVREGRQTATHRQHLGKDKSGTRTFGL